MSLQFIMGGSGSGKTRFLYESLIDMSIKDPKTNYFAIVPEQATMQTQKEIVGLHPMHGTMDIDILSFLRLAYRICQELSVQQPDVLDDEGKSMIIRKTASEHKKELALFKDNLGRTGFISQVKSMLSEFYQYGVTSDDLRSMLDELTPSVLRMKLSDMAVIYDGFKDYIDKKYIIKEEILDVLCRLIPESEMIKDSVISLDGFTGFTPVQYHIIQLLMQYCKKVIITVTIDENTNAYKEGKVHELFHMSRHMVCRLVDLAAEINISKDEDIILSSRPFYRFSKSPALEFLEKNVFRYNNRKYDKAVNEIMLIQAENPESEISWAANTINRLVMEEGFRYRDIALVTGDMGSYTQEIERQFEAQSIPFFMDNKKNIIGNPAAALIRSMLEVIEYDFSYESVFAYLKTGFVYSSEEDINMLENYVLALGIHGAKRWNTEWDKVWYGAENIELERINKIREYFVNSIMPVKEAFTSRARTVKSMTDAMRDWLDKLNLKEKLENYAEYFDKQGEHSLEKEYSSIYELIIKLLERLVDLLGDEVMSVAEYADTLNAGFEEIKIGIIPAVTDRVIVGDITRTRLDNIKALIFAGVNEGIIPSRGQGKKLITDKEREVIKKHSIELAPSSKEEGYMQRFYLYMMMTKPTDRLYVTYASMGSDGKGRRPSSLIGELKLLFPQLSAVSTEDSDMTIYTYEEAKRKLISCIRNYDENCSDSHFLELFKTFYSNPEYKKYAADLVAAATYVYRESGIGKIAAHAVYGNILQGSVTRMEQYAACAYEHFLRYGLMLSKRQQFEIAAVDIGNMFHQSIDLYFTKIKENKKSFKEINDNERKQLVSECVREVSEKYGQSVMTSTSRYAYLTNRVERMTDRTIWALSEQIKKGDFEPDSFELSFSANDNLNAMRIKLSEDEEIRLRGRIDRVDLYEDNDNIYVKIIDYKSGSTSFDLNDLYYGLQMQLVVYMSAALELKKRTDPDKNIIPAGIFYYNISDPVIEKKEGMSDDEIEQAIFKSLRMNGLVNSDLDVIRHMDRDIETDSDVIPVALKEGIIQEAKSSVAGTRRFNALTGYVNEKLKTMGQDILSGDIEINPYRQSGKTACDYCIYHAICGFDRKISGYNYRKFKSLKSEDIWADINKNNDKEDKDGSELD